MVCGITYKKLWASGLPSSCDFAVGRVKLLVQLHQVVFGYAAQFACSAPRFFRKPGLRCKRPGSFGRAAGNGRMKGERLSVGSAALLFFELVLQRLPAVVEESVGC